MVLKEHNLKDEFSELVLGFLDWLSDMIRFKDINDSVSSSKESKSNDRVCDMI